MRAERYIIKQTSESWMAGPMIGLSTNEWPTNEIDDTSRLAHEKQVAYQKYYEWPTKKKVPVVTKLYGVHKY